MCVLFQSSLQVAHEWTRGVPFNTICLQTNVLEGSIVRCILRIAETCRDIQSAAKIVGDIGKDRDYILFPICLFTGSFIASIILRTSVIVLLSL